MPKKSEVQNTIAPSTADKTQSNSKVFSFDDYKIDELDNIRKLIASFKDDKDQYQQLFEKYNEMYINITNHIKEVKTLHTQVLGVLAMLSNECLVKFNSKVDGNSNNQNKEVVASEQPAKNSAATKEVAKEVVKEVAKDVVKETEKQPVNNEQPANADKKKVVKKVAKKKPSVDETTEEQKPVKKASPPPVADAAVKEETIAEPTKNTAENTEKTVKKTVKKVVKKVKKTD